MLKMQMFGGFYQKEMNEEAEEWLKKLEKKYGKPSVGRNRACFYSKHCVLKFPINDNGICDNDWEGSCSSEEYAKGKRIKLGNFVCVMQEKLSYPKSYKNLPSWVDFIDCMQVGYTKKGQLKAYDFGLR